MSDFNFEKYMLEQFTKFGKDQEEIKRDVTDMKGDLVFVKTRIGEYDPADLPILKSSVRTIQDLVEDHEKRIREVQEKQTKFAGTWSILAIIGGVCLTACITALMAMVFGTKEPEPNNKDIHYIPMGQKAVPAKQVSVKELLGE